MSKDAFYIPEGAKGTKARYIVVIICFAAYFFDSYDMYILGISMQSILGELQLTTEQGGLLSSATMLGAVLGSLFLGKFSSNQGNKLCLIICTAWIGLMSLGVTLVSNFYAWFILRVLVGLGIGGIMGPIHALIWQHWAPGHRALVTGFTFSSFPVAGIAAALMGKLIIIADWRLLFITAGISIIVSLIAIKGIPNDRHLIPAGQIKAGKKDVKFVKFQDIFTGYFKWITLFAVLASFANMAGGWAMNTWIPSWLQVDRGMDIALMTDFATMNYVGCLAGYLIWGWIGSTKIGAGRALVFCYITAAVCLLLYLILPGGAHLIYLGPLMYFGQGGCGCLNSVLFAEAYPERTRAYGSGTAFNFGRIGSIISPYTIAVVGTAYGLTAGLLLAPAFFAIGIFATVFLLWALKKQAKVDALRNAKTEALEVAAG
jgi:MFS family permease